MLTLEEIVPPAITLGWDAARVLHADEGEAVRVCTVLGKVRDIHPTALPDLSDDLTRLGLITLVQEAHPECRIDLCVDLARVIRSGGEAGNLTDGWLPTAEALVKALEAAPIGGER